MNIAARIVPIFTLPKISDVKSPQMIKDNTQPLMYQNIL